VYIFLETHDVVRAKISKAIEIFLIIFCCLRFEFYLGFIVTILFQPKLDNDQNVWLLVK
jgi:hypothetical protein